MSSLFLTTQICYNYLRKPSTQECYACILCMLFAFDSLHALCTVLVSIIIIMYIYVADTSLVKITAKMLTVSFSLHIM